jgi:folate-binding protein YgfZ
MNSALQVALSKQSGAVIVPVGDYRGASVAARFTDPQAELLALRTGCGVYDLGFRVKLALTGGDRVRWLNGMVTNNIRDLAPEDGLYAFLLNPQGRILGDLYAYNRGEAIIVDTDRSQLEKILATFDHYIIMDDVEIGNLGDSMTALGIAGPKSRKLLEAVGFAVPKLSPLQIRDVKWQEVDCTLVRGEEVRGEEPGHASYQIWLLPDEVNRLWNALLTAGATPVGSEALEMQRILSGIPLYGVDIRERDLPQETEQTRALNFNKGCYVGQEIVERIRSRGAVHRKFSGFMVEGTARIAPGAKIVVGNKEVGEITSAIALHGSGADRTLALGYIRREASIPGKEAEIDAAKASVSDLPFKEVMLTTS